MGTLLILSIPAILWLFIGNKVSPEVEFALAIASLPFFFVLFFMALFIWVMLFLAFFLYEKIKHRLYPSTPY
jgi:hypothetical protein